jgi:hypothetical protein
MLNCKTLSKVDEIDSQIMHITEENATILNTPDPTGRCEASLSALTWEERVLLRGTKHYGEGLSRLCDAKMSEVVASLGWACTGARVAGTAAPGLLPCSQGRVWRAPPRAVCAPAAPVVRAEYGARFDSRFMEDATVGRAGRLEPASMKMDAAVGFSPLFRMLQ